MDWTGKRVNFIDEDATKQYDGYKGLYLKEGIVKSEPDKDEIVRVLFNGEDKDTLVFTGRLEIIDKEQENKMNEIKPTMMYTKADLETAYKMGYEKGKAESTKIDEPKKVWKKAVYNKLKVGDKVRFVGTYFFDEDTTNKIIDFSGIKCGEECTVTDWIDGILVATKDDNDPIPLNFCILLGIGVEVLV